MEFQVAAKALNGHRLTLVLQTLATNSPSLAGRLVVFSWRSRSRHIVNTGDTDDTPKAAGAREPLLYAGRPERSSGRTLIVSVEAGMIIKVVLNVASRKSGSGLPVLLEPLRDRSNS